MRIATFNLENLSARRTPNDDFQARCQILRPQLNRLQADILCLQEVGAEHDGNKSSPRHFRALTSLLEGTRYADYFQAHSTLKDGRGPMDVHNLITLSRYPIVHRRQLWNDLVAAPRYEFKTANPSIPDPVEIVWDRPVLHTEIDIGTDRHLHVFNLHLRAPLASFVPGQKSGQFKWRSVSGWAEGFFVATIKRSGQALEARFAIDALFDKQTDALIAVCGDMNAGDQEMPLRILKGDKSETENSTLETRTMFPLEKIVSADRQYSVIHGGHPAMLDHLLVSQSLLNRFQSISIDNDSLPDELTDYQRKTPLSGSHHAPIVACFKPL